MHMCTMVGMLAVFCAKSEQELSAKGCASIQPYGIRMNIRVDQEGSDSRKGRSMIRPFHHLS
jgi:hypothetical protein